MFSFLQVCAQSVVNQFATIAHKTNFLYCYAILDSNRRTSARDAYPTPPNSTNSSLGTLRGPLRALSATSLLATAVLASNEPTPRQLLVAEEMDSFFPFDPFKLPLSAPYIDNIYLEWEGEDESGSEASTDSDDDDDDDASSDVSDTETDEVFARGGLAVPGSKYGAADGGESDDEVARSFEAMSLSPDRSAFGGRARLSGSMMPIRI